jgi:hypothetical protein
MIRVLADIAVILSCVVSIFTCLYVVLVVRALYADLVERGIAPKLMPLPVKKHEFRTPVQVARDNIAKRGGLNG